MEYITINQIAKKYKNKEILRDVSFTVKKGDCVGILGSNGSGKSTLLKTLAGVISPDQGTFTLMGKDMFKDRKTRMQRIGYVPQGTPLMEELSALDNLRLWYSAENLKKELEHGMLADLGIEDFLKTPVNKMSGGMKKRLSIGCAAANHPSVLLLDEPGTALDLVCKKQIFSYYRSYLRQGGTMLLVTHDVQELSLCNKFFLLQDGIAVPYDYHGNPNQLVEDLQG